MLRKLITSTAKKSSNVYEKSFKMRNHIYLMHKSGLGQKMKNDMI